MALYTVAEDELKNQTGFSKVEEHMTQARLRTIEEIFHSALEQAPGQISTFLDTACQGDETLRTEVEALLKAYEPARGFIGTSAIGVAAKILENTPADARTGLKIGHYELEERIGTGGMGEVYRAADIVAGRKAALKLLPTRYTGDANRIERFAQEARAVVALNHPNILTIYEIGEQDATHYIASELIDGETLRQRLARGPMGVEEALDVAIQVASALHAAHEAGIVHRDIKPENIMLRPDGYVKVLDFGIAKLAHEKMPILPGQEESIFLVETHLGAVLGTARYMAPEQVRAAPLSQGADIWSLGVVLYEMLAGRTPFTGETPQEVMHAILTTEPPPLTGYLTKPPNELQAIIERTLRKNSEERYPDAGELIKALKATRRGLDLGAEREKLTSVTSPRQWMLPATALSLAVSVIAFALAFYWQRNPATNSPPENSIAVLPFVNTSGDPNSEYFSDGLSQELIAVLAKIPTLKIISRSSSFEFKGTSEDSRTIGHKLGVMNLLKGSVRKQGARVQIVSKLIRAADGQELWTETYDRELKDVFAMQSEIATAVAGQLKIKLLGPPPQSDAAPLNENLAAYTAFQQGVFYHTRGNEEGARKAIEFYDEAIRLDPTYALAYAQLAMVWQFLGDRFLGGDELADAYSKTRRAAQKALSLPPNIPEAHLAMGGLLMTVDHNYDAAEIQLRQADALAPGQYDPKAALAFLFLTQARLAEAEEMARKVEPLEPLALKLNLVRILIARGKYDEAEAFLRRAIEMRPKAATLHMQITNIYLLQGKTAAALEEARLEPAGFWQDYAIALAQQAQGNHGSADTALKQFVDKHGVEGGFQVATIYALRKESDEMFSWLKRAYEENDPGMIQLLTGPFIRNYSGDPRFATLCQKLKLPVPQSSEVK